MIVPRITTTTTGSVSSAAINGAAKAASVVSPIARSKRNAARGRDADPQTGEARPGCHRDTVNGGEIKLNAVEHPSARGISALTRCIGNDSCARKSSAPCQHGGEQPRRGIDSRTRRLVTTDMAGLVSAPAASSQQRKNVDARRIGQASSK
jgi:hypothetical protein